MALRRLSNSATRALTLDTFVAQLRASGLEKELQDGRVGMLLVVLMQKIDPL